MERQKRSTARAVQCSEEKEKGGGGGVCAFNCNFIFYTCALFERKLLWDR